jgi:hypothetical protein
VPPRYRNPPPCLGGLWHYHVSKALGPSLSPRRSPALPHAQRHWTLPPPLAIQERSATTTCPSTLDPASLLRRDPALTHVHRLRTAPASMVDSGADMCPMALRGLWVVEIKEGLAATTCNEALVYPRHARVLPRHLQDVWADGVIMICKPCGRHYSTKLQCIAVLITARRRGTTVPHRAADRSWAW